MKKVVVFAGNECRPEKQDYYYSLAYKTGQLLAKNGYIVASGGGPGLMNQVMKGAYQAGGKTIAICLVVEGRKHTAFTSEKQVYHDLDKRQQKLISLGDAFIALPGGIGTLYEIAAVLALKRKREIKRSSPFVLIDRYYRNFADLLKFMYMDRFIPGELLDFYRVAATPEEAISILKKGSNR